MELRMTEERFSIYSASSGLTRRREIKMENVKWKVQNVFIFRFQLSISSVVRPNRLSLLWSRDQNVLNYAKMECRGGKAFPPVTPL
jgi:hypothetical protein